MNEFYIEYNDERQQALLKMNGEPVAGEHAEALIGDELARWFTATEQRPDLGTVLDQQAPGETCALLFQGTADDFAALQGYFDNDYQGPTHYLLRHVMLGSEKGFSEEEGEVLWGPLVNDEKQGTIEWQGKKYLRIAIKTPVVLPGDDLHHEIDTYGRPYIQPGDILFMSEKMVATTQHRAIHVDTIHPRPLARFLSGFVYKNPGGVGLSIPLTMEMALRECGTLRILFAAVCGAFGKLIGKRGWFYILAGYKAASIDGPSPKNIPPYDKYVILGPENPDGVAQELAEHLDNRCGVLIIDVNDFGGVILGKANAPLTREDYAGILRDNPLGQTHESTPLGLIRPLE